MRESGDVTLLANGLDATTGEYLVPPMTATEVARIATETELPRTVQKGAAHATPPRDRAGLRGEAGC